MDNHHSMLAASAVCLLLFPMIKTVGGLTLQGRKTQGSSGTGDSNSLHFPLLQVCANKEIRRDDADKSPVHSNTHCTWGWA